MKIRFLVHNLYAGASGGVLTTTVTLARELAARHDVELVTVLRTQDEPARRLPAELPVRVLYDMRAGGALHKLSSRFSSRLITAADRRHGRHHPLSDLALWRYLRSVRDGALIGMQPGINVAIARHACPGVVRVVQDHRPFASRSRNLREHYVRNAPRLDAFLTLTERDAEQARRSLDDVCTVEAIPNATPVYDGPTSDQSSPVVLAAGWLKHNKGHDRLISAWAKVAPAHPGWRLHIFGRGPEHAKLEAQISELGLEGTVVLRGYSPDLHQEMAQASIFAMGSRFEGYGMVLVEAMSCGLPVVSFDCPTGPREVVDDGINGCLVPNGDVGAMARELTRFIEMGPERRGRMGATAQAAALARSPAAVSERWEALLTRLHLEKQRRTLMAATTCGTGEWTVPH